MRPIVLVTAVAFCGLLAACPHTKDTGAHKEWLRPVEPRLAGASRWQRCTRSLAPGHVVEDAVCGAPRKVLVTAAVCDGILKTREDAVQLLVDQPACIDEAIVALERFARVDPGVGNSDLSAAYYLRAQQEDRASDLLFALDAADRAVKSTPGLAEAHFNQALAREALGLREAAIKAWDDVRSIDSGQWRTEAKDHRDRLATIPDAARQWAKNRGQLPVALRSHDREAVARLIKPFPATAEHYLEDEVLYQWAVTGDGAIRANVQTLASALTQSTGNHYFQDLANGLELSSPEAVAVLRRGVLAFHEARLSERSIDPAAAAAKYETAARLLDVAASPLALSARLGQAIATFNVRDHEPAALSLLDAIEQRAKARRYEDLVGRVHANRAYAFFWLNRYVESFAELEKALAIYESIGNTESDTATRIQWAGNYRTIGLHERSIREAVQMTRRVTELVDTQPRHAVLGDAAATSLALGHPLVALLYQNTGIAVIRRAIVATPPERREEITRLQKNLAVAFRQRADIEVALPDYKAAVNDLDEAARQMPGHDRTDLNIRALVQARMDEVTGRALLSVNPSQAAAAFSRAIALAGDNETFLASLFAQRADAFQLIGRQKEAQDDRQSTIEHLGIEEKNILRARERGKAESVLSAYFSRFQDTYRRLVQQFAADGNLEQAFVYTERARAIEPLNLVLQTPVVPAEFRALSQGGPLSLANIQAHLPAGTYLLEFCVLNDLSYTWVISRDGVKLVKSDVGAGLIERWASTVLRAAKKRNDGALQDALVAPSTALLREPLDYIRKRHPAGEELRLVIIPDRALHGIPFAALHNPWTGHYLIDDAIVSGSGSATLYIFSMLRDQALTKRRSPEALLIRDPAFDPNMPSAQGLLRLKGAQSEIDRISLLYARNQVLRDADATVPHVLQAARTCDVIHFAGHAIANAQEPFRSLLLLAPSPRESGALEAAALVRNLRADHARLAVLSTCSSTGGSSVGPEGVAPLVRPLIGAGIPAVIGTLWNVQDATTPDLLVSFHRRYRQGSDAAKALAEAQRTLLHGKHPGLASVLAWAPFEVIGYASSPFRAGRNTKGEPP